MDRTDEITIDLRDVSALDADAAGTIYGLLRNEDGSMSIVLLDGRQEVLEAQQRQGSVHDPVRITRPIASQIVRTQPALDFDVQGLQVAPSGRYLVLHGTSDQDASTVVLAVVDLHGGQPLPAPHGGGGARLKQCRLHLVDPVLFESRPGLVLYQSSWHPHSEEHLVVLTSDNRLRLYHITHNLGVAEQTLHVRPSSGTQPQRYGLAAPVATLPGAAGAAGLLPAAGELPTTADVVAFGFGPAVGWGMFAMLLLAADGQVYALGPVAPFGMRCPAALLERLGQEEEAAAEWLEAAFGADAVRSPASRNRWPVLPHVVDGVSPALVGPLNLRSRQELPLPSRAISLAVSHTLSIPAAAPTAAAAPGAASTTTAVVGYADGRLLAYTLAGPWSPSWCESAPQYMSVSGTASAAPSAVRYKCTLRSAAGSGGGFGGMSVGDAAAAAAATATPRMALLDVVELPATATARGAGGGGSSDDEEDEDGDLSGGGCSVSASAVAAARRAMTLHMQAGIAGATTAAVGGAVTVWICFRTGGCWRVVLPWSAMLPRWLGTAAAGGGSSGVEPLPAELPPPVVTCVYDVVAATQGSMTPAAAASAAGNAAAVGCCLMANPLLGGGLLLLSAAGSLHYFQPPGAASLLADQQQQQQQQSAATSTMTVAQRQQQQPGQAAAAASARLPTASPEQRKAQVEAHVKSVYGNLVVPPPDRKLPKPPTDAPSPLTVASPEGLRHLTDCIAALRGKHMAFLHGASVDLIGRAEALRSEAGKHAAAVAELTDKEVALEERQEELETRIRRLKQLHDNLVERAGMLASLHWSLPRALSRAELATREELGAFEARSQSMAAQWEMVAARARRLCEERRGSGALGRCAALRMASVPEAQLDKVRDAVATQFSGLAASRAALSELERHVAAAAADRTAEQLEKGLGLAAGGTGLAAGGTPEAGLSLGLLGLRVA